MSQSIPVPAGTEMTPVSPQSPDQSGGLFGWFSGNKMISKVVEKTKVCNDISRLMSKQDFCVAKKKDADQLCSNCTADERLCFWYIASTIPAVLFSH